MNSSIKKILMPFVPQFVLNSMLKKKQIREYQIWQENGFPAPAPHIAKQNTIAEYQQKYGFTTLVETGTYLGEMVAAQKSRFDKIVSIELSDILAKKAVNRFKNDRNVTIVQGDCAEVLPKILLDINEPAIFWLDAHYSAGITAKGDTDCPIFGELDAIFGGKNMNHVLLIDDANEFVGKGDYPKIEELTKFIKGKNEKYELEVKHNIIRYVV